MLLDAGVRVHPVDVPAPGGRSGHDGSAAPLRSLDDEAPHPVNLFILNPPSLARLLESRPRAVRMEGRTNALLPFWELPRLPPAWLPALEEMDLLVAAGEFIRHTLASEVAHPQVRLVRHPVHLDDGVAADRRAWGFPRGTTVFLTAFELASDVHRKNPAGAIDAFQRAFPRDPDARLLVKLNNPAMRAAFRPHVEALRERAAADPRVRLLDRVLEYREMLSLIASADVFLSLHRAEGLGLCLLEAMALGRPVVATGWSGNLEYMDDRNACLVDCDLVPVRGATHPAYAPGNLVPDARWAEPRLDHAADWLVRLARDRALRRRIGDRARADLRRRRSDSGAGALLAALGERRAGPVLARSPISA
jgi:glycosyltransferase involved in cell wall biosynthesis